MFITICVLILAYMILGKDIKHLLEKIQEVDWEGHCNKAWNVIKKHSRKIGRATCDKCLKLWFVLNEPTTPTLDKIIIYGAIIYTVSPWSILPVTRFRFIGVLDEGAAINFAINRVSKNITPSIENKVKDILEEWFGPEYSVRNADV